VPGKRLLLLRSRIVVRVAAPTVNAIQLALPCSTAALIANRLRNGPSAMIEKPNSLGSWLINTVGAMPFM
jgi:hypothetical protein